jgi:BMFP domain-containing protein YqiC
MSDNNQEVFNNVLAITRDQLSKSMNLSAELEALLLIERKKTSDLEAKIAELQAKSEEKTK